MVNDRRSDKQPSQNSVLVKSGRKSRTPVKMTATEAHLSAIHKEVLFYFRAQHIIPERELQRLKFNIKRMKCSLPREHKIWKTIQDMLAKINNRHLTSKRATTTNKNVYPSTDSSLFTTTQEKENVPSNSQTSSSHAMKLRSHNTQNDESSLSFPLELLTNVNFEDTQKSAASAETENGNEYTHIFNEELELIIQGNCPAEINSARIENSQIISQCSINTIGTLGVMSPSTPEDNSPSALEIQDIPTDSATRTSNGEYIEMPSEGTWEEANIRISQETGYDFDETNIPEIIFVDDDDLGNNNFAMDDGENECFEFNETDATLCSVNISNNDPPETRMCHEDVESESFEFNLKENESNTVIEGTPIAAKHYLLNQPTDNTISQEVELVVPNETPLMESLSKLSVINASQENTVDETQYANSESGAIFKTNSWIHRHGGPYKRRSQSTSCLNYKAKGKSSSSLNKRQSFGNNESQFVAEEIDNTQTSNQIFPSENLMLINGSIHQMGTVANTPEEESSFSDKQKALKEKVMKERSKYASKWKDMPISEKVSAKFAEKFHVRIFDDPVESLTNIDYSPNFDNFSYPRLSIKQMHEQMMASYDMTLKMDAALVKVVGECAEANKRESTFVSPRNSADESDSDSSDEDVCGGASNKKWLKDYFANTAKHDTNEFMKEMYKKQREENIRTTQSINNSNEQRENEDVCSDELLDELLIKFGDCDWIREQND